MDKTEDVVSYGNVVYDYGKNACHIWEFKNGTKFYKQIPHKIEYYIDDADKKSSIKDPFGNPALKQEAGNLAVLKGNRQYNLKMYESDIDQETKFLHSQFEGVKVFPKIEDYQVCFLDIEIQVEDEFPEPAFAKYPINLITVYMSKFEQFYTFGLNPYYGHACTKYIHCRNETELLERFVRFFNRCKVDIITGWNCGFDIDSIVNRIEKIGSKASLSPLKYYRKSLETWKRQQNGQTGGGYMGEGWAIPGVAVLDYMQFFKDPKFMQKRFESYSLQNIGMEILGRGKLEYEGTFNELYRKEWDKFVDYNVEDVRLVLDIDKKKKFVELALNLSHKSLIPIEKVFSAVAVIEGQLLSYFHENNMVMNDRDKSTKRFDIPGGFTKANPGYYENGVSIDAESLYPMMIIHWGVSPENLVLDPSDEMKPNLQRTPVSDSHGVYFKKQNGFLCDLTKKNRNERRLFKDLAHKYEMEGDLELAGFYNTQQNVRKTFLNSIYGCCCNEGFHYFNPSLALAITLGGQNLIKHMERRLNEYYTDEYLIERGAKPKEIPSVTNRIILMDTDSVFLCFDDIRKTIYKKESSPDWGFRFMEDDLKKSIEGFCQEYFSAYGVTNRMNFKIEKVIDQILVFAKKSYACRISANEGVVYNPPKMSVTGYASKKSDRPKYCRKKLDVILSEFFKYPSKTHVLGKLQTIKDEFSKLDMETVAKPNGITDLDKFAGLIDFGETGMINFGKSVPFHIKAAYSYNHLVKILGIPRPPASPETGIKCVYVKPNCFGFNVIGFVGNCPEEIKKSFEVDYDRQFDVNMMNPIQKMFDAMDWGQVSLNDGSLDSFLE